MGNMSSSTDKVWLMKVHNSSEITMRWEPFLRCSAAGSRKPLGKFYLEIPPKGLKKFDTAEYHKYDDNLYALYINVFPASLTSEDPACSSVIGNFTYYGGEIKINYVPGGRVEFDPPGATKTFPRLGDFNTNAPQKVGQQMAHGVERVEEQHGVKEHEVVGDCDRQMTLLDLHQSFIRLSIQQTEILLSVSDRFGAVDNCLRDMDTCISALDSRLESIMKLVQDGLLPPPPPPPPPPYQE